MIKCVRYILTGKEDDINKTLKYLEETLNKIDSENSISIEMDGQAEVFKEWLDLRKRAKKYMKIYKKQIETVENMKKREEIK